MDRMLVVIFDDEKKAYEGRNALLDLDREGSIAVFASVVVAKGADGTVTVKEERDVAPLGTLVATSLGSLIGLLGGAPGVAIGALSGLTVGGVADVANFSIGEDFVADVTAALAPNTFAVVAEIEEDWTTPVDSRMEKIGGTVFRRSLSEVRDTIDREQIAAMKADRAQMKAEAAQAAADRKRKLGEKIDRLDAKIQAHMQKAKERRQAAESEAQAKAKILKSKVAAIRP